MASNTWKLECIEEEREAISHNIIALGLGLLSPLLSLSGEL